MTETDDIPEWWRENEQLKAELELQRYEPPRFADGTYAFELVAFIEDEYDCRVRLLGVNTRYRDDWEVRVDGETAFDVGRRRDNNGNTVYETTAERFEDSVREYLDESGRTHE